MAERSHHRILKLLLPRHTSTWSYVAWSGLYALVGIYQLAGGRISSDLGGLFFVDFFVNLVMPFNLLGVALVVAQFSEGFTEVKWSEWFVLVIVFLVTIVLPAVVLVGLGGLPVLFGAVLFVSKFSWYGSAKERGKTLFLLFARGIGGPFLFFAPALLVSTILVGRSTLAFNETDWVAVFGVIYFLTQAVFEEFLLRRIEKTLPKALKEDGS